MSQNVLWSLISIFCLFYFIVLLKSISYIDDTRGNISASQKTNNLKCHIFFFVFWNVEVKPTGLRKITPAAQRGQFYFLCVMDIWWKTFKDEMLKQGTPTGLSHFTNSDIILLRTPGPAGCRSEPPLVVVTFSQRVQRVDHQLEDGAPQGGVVEGGRAAASLQHGTHLQDSRHAGVKLQQECSGNVKLNRCKPLKANRDIKHSTGL